MSLKKLSGWGALFTGLLSMVLTSAAHAAYELNMPKSVTPIGHELYGLHMLVFWSSAS